MDSNDDPDRPEDIGGHVFALTEECCCCSWICTRCALETALSYTAEYIRDGSGLIMDTIGTAQRSYWRCTPDYPRSHGGTRSGGTADFSDAGTCVGSLQGSALLALREAKKVSGFVP